MRGNLFGKMLSIVSFGESHGPAIGVVIDGVPSGLAFSQADLQRDLDRRAPGRIAGTTTRKEPDTAEVLSGIFEGKTLGSPIAVIVRNTSQQSGDYDKLKNEIRPGHADQTSLDKYGIRDHRGGGRASGRETIARVIGGYFASLVLPKVHVRAMTTKLGNFEWKYNPTQNMTADFGPYGFPDATQTEAIAAYLLELKAQGNSIGGKACIVVDNCPAGLGEPAFDKLKADLSKALLSIGSIVSFSYGLGEEMAQASGQAISNDRSSFGGIEGGISNGERIFMQVTFKPTSTVGEHAKKGRHDPCIIPRALPVVESMVKLVLADHFLRQQAYTKK